MPKKLKIEKTWGSYEEVCGLYKRPLSKPRNFVTNGGNKVDSETKASSSIAIAF